MKFRVIVVSALLVIAPSVALSQSPRGMTTPSVLDAQNRFVGDIIGIGSGQARGAGVVRLELESGETVLVPVGRKNRALTWIQDQDVFFESTNCSGAPLGQVSFPVLAERISLVVGSTLWISDPDPMPDSSITFRSILRAPGGFCDSGASGFGTMVRMPLSVDLESKFSHPLKLVETRQRPVR